MADVNADAQCPRCLQPFKAGSRSCPSCGERLSGSPRRMLLFLGGIGALFLLAVIALAVYMKPTVDEDAAGAPQQEQAAPAQPAKKPLLD